MAVAAAAARSAPVPEAVEALRHGRMVVVCDDTGPDGGGELVLAAEFASAAALNFMAANARGLARLALTEERHAALGLRQLEPPGRERGQLPFTVPVDARDGGVSGRSAAGRAHTIRVAVAPETAPRDLVHGGHVLPVMTHPRGVQGRPDHANAAVDLARLAGLTPAAVCCGIDTDDGAVARTADLHRFVARHGLAIVTIADVIAYRRSHEPLVERVVATALPTRFGDFTAMGYRDLERGGHYLALVKGDLAGAGEVLVAVHAECLFGDAFHSLACDCGSDLEGAMVAIEREDSGAVVYLPGEAPWASADVDRQRAIAAQILTDLGVRSIRLHGGDRAITRALRERGLAVA